METILVWFTGRNILLALAVAGALWGAVGGIVYIMHDGPPAWLEQERTQRNDLIQRDIDAMRAMSRK